MCDSKACSRCAISPTRSENFPGWYQQVIKAADLAENSPVRGCMVIKPWGYAVWERIQNILDGMLKASGHKNVYFPLFIPLKYFEKEAEHVDGFAKECAIVTHTRLQSDGKGGLEPTSKLEEPLIVRPTSETIIGETFAKWVHSYRDLPIKINQWANVVRWEMRARMFLRTTEFLWQEGHTAHSTSVEAELETSNMLSCYIDFAENYLAIPVIAGMKTESEKFPGAVATYSIEAMMQDGKALQAGTSHFLGQNFSRSANIKFVNEDGAQDFAWTTSWGVSTRLIGGVIMTHSDDNGLVLPPNIAPVQIVICPIYKDDTRSCVMEYCESLKNELSSLSYNNEPLRVEIDDRDIRGGEKSWELIKRGVPIRVEVGMRDIDAGSICFFRRDNGPKERSNLAHDVFVREAHEILNDIHNALFARAKQYRDDRTCIVNSNDELYDYFQQDDAGFAYSHWCGDPDIETQLKSDLGVTIRCLPLSEQEPGVCAFTGRPSKQRAVFARSY